MKRKMFAALALSATLAMGAVPAFAEEPAENPLDGSVTDAQKIDKTTGQNTVVSVKTVVGQIDATVPTKVVVSANTDGGDVAVPSATAYKIVNNSIFDLHVNSVKAEVGSNWAFSKDAIKTPIPDPTTGKIGDIYMALAPEGKADTASFDLTNTAAFKYSADWKIPAKSTDPGVLGLQLKGGTSRLSQVLAEGTTSDAMTITFTVSTVAPATA